MNKIPVDIDNVVQNLSYAIADARTDADIEESLTEAIEDLIFQTAVYTSKMLLNPDLVNEISNHE